MKFTYLLACVGFAKADMLGMINAMAAHDNAQADSFMGTLASMAVANSKPKKSSMINSIHAMAASQANERPIMRNIAMMAAPGGKKKDEAKKKGEKKPKASPGKSFVNLLAQMAIEESKKPNMLQMINMMAANKPKPNMLHTINAMASVKHTKKGEFMGTIANMAISQNKEIEEQKKFSAAMVHTVRNKGLMNMISSLHTKKHAEEKLVKSVMQTRFLMLHQVSDRMNKEDSTKLMNSFGRLVQMADKEKKQTRKFMNTIGRFVQLENMKEKKAVNMISMMATAN